MTMCVKDKQSSKVLVGKRPGPRREEIFLTKLFFKR